MKEIEIKIVDFNEPKLRAALKRSKAKYLGKSSLKRLVFDAMPETSEQDELIRIRTDGNRTTLTWKYRDNRGKNIDNTDEIEVEVSDFDKTAKIISKIWKGTRPYRQETKLEKWDYKGVEVAICTWPLVPQFIEVEGKTEKAVRSAVRELGIEGKDMGNSNLRKIFARYGQEGKDLGDLRF
jgi:adenylate cyclase, class 2